MFALSNSDVYNDDDVDAAGTGCTENYLLSSLHCESACVLVASRLPVCQFAPSSQRSFIRQKEYFDQLFHEY